MFSGYVYCSCFVPGGRDPHTRRRYSLLAWCTQYKTPKRSRKTKIYSQHNGSAGERCPPTKFTPALTAKAFTCRGSQKQKKQNCARYNSSLGGAEHPRRSSPCYRTKNNYSRLSNTPTAEKTGRQNHTRQTAKTAPMMVRHRTDVPAATQLGGGMAEHIDG